MRKSIAVFIATLFIPLSAAAETLVFSPLPMETPYVVASQWKPLLDDLENATGIAFKIDYSANNDEVVAKLKSGKTDLAYLGPLPYVALKKEFPAAEPVVVFHERDGEHTYTCALVVSGESALALEGLKDHKIALTQPLSTCGYFATEGLLQQMGSSLASNLYRYLGPHDEVALSVVRGEFDAGGLKTAIARKYAHLGLTIRKESPPMPGLALVANSQRVPAEQIRRIREALLAADEESRRTWGDNIRHGVSAAHDSDYDGMRHFPMPLSIPDRGNY